ncbi:vitelline membrane outer layer protein 1-like isoform 1-T2 [Clarias gariepinus]|uniref:vitelline membrane outer layer protein 1-like n=1 Tax=Clarias gariepinus TaxID=13013 RepID=UPI00234D3E8C|nr:vitelline membrane outer layer protein 1-like [Clarias gariepinus]XP_053335153.1 vitelline membrane outer layer protein 1-like [Clarias gariepinus]
MDFVFKIVFLLFFLQFISVSNGKVERPYRSKIAVSNGGTLGSWGPREMCPFGTYATGFSLKVEEELNDDNTALNGISLYCSGSPLSSQPESTVESDEGSWGNWTEEIYCDYGVLIAFQLCVEGSQGDGDDTAANNIRFLCSSGERLTGDGMSWGKWGKRSATCFNSAICGIQTRVEPPQNPGDNTALNDVRFFCCT